LLSALPPESPSAAEGALQRRLSPVLYRAWGRVGLSAIGPRLAAVTVILIGVACSGCSMARGPFARMTDNDLPTGSVMGAGGPQPTDSDLAFARNAASDVLTKGDKDSSQPWENPQTGARGSVTPVAATYADDDGRTCRDFLASYVNGKTEAWLQGAACKNGRGRWEIHTLKPWRRS
jgi:surface antigen